MLAPLVIEAKDPPGCHVPAPVTNHCSGTFYPSLKTARDVSEHCNRSPGMLLPKSDQLASTHFCQTNGAVISWLWHITVITLARMHRTFLGGQGPHRGIWQTGMKAALGGGRGKEAVKETAETPTARYEPTKRYVRNNLTVEPHCKDSPRRPGRF